METPSVYRGKWEDGFSAKELARLWLAGDGAVPIAALRPWASVLTWPEPSAKVPAEQVIVPVRRRDRAQADELTGQEHRVAMLMAHGATIREAATQLFLSLKTIEAHLGRVYRKLGIHNRAQLATQLATERQWLPSSVGRV